MKNASDTEIDLKVKQITASLQPPHSVFYDVERCRKDYREATDNPKMWAKLKPAIDKTVKGLMEKIHIALEALENSEFYKEFMEQMQDPEILEQIQRVRGTDPHHSHLQMVFYGIGNIDPEIRTRYSHSRSQMQLAFAILMKEKFDFVNDIVLYDPILSTIERTAINELGCTVLHDNEFGKRTVDRPTIFFMPNCPFYLHDNVLGANWTPANLNKIIVLSYTFQDFPNDKSLGFTKVDAVRSSDRLLHEVRLPQTDITPAVYEEPFRDFSWHFFAWDGSLEDLNKLEEPYLCYKK